MKIALISLIGIVAVPYFASAQDTTDKYSGNIIRKISLSAYVGQKYGLGSSAFFDDYALYFGGKKLSFPLSPAFGASVKMELLPNIRFGIGCEYFSADFTDNYSQPVFLNPSDTMPFANREISQQYSFAMNTVLLTTDYIPVATPYRTYVGVGAGAAFGHVQWTEAVHSTDLHDKRIGGQYLNENVVGPSGVLYAGVELAFDRRKYDGDLMLLTIEARYTVVGVGRPVFAKAARQFAALPSHWNESKPIGASGLTLQLGLTFEFVPRRK